MQKTIIVFLFMFFLIVTPVLAAKGQDDSPGVHNGGQNEIELYDDVENQEIEIEDEIDDTQEALEEVEDVEEPFWGNQIKNQEQEQEQEIEVKKARSTNQLREIIKSKKAELENEVEELKDKAQQKIYKNQNAVREAVHLFLSSEDLVGGIGQQVSEIAQEFNNSVEKTVQAEEKIQKRSKFVKFLIGGVKDAAHELKNEAQKNKEKIQELKALKEKNWMQKEVKEMFQEQIQNIEQEQNRLEELANKEINKKGIFGWFVKLFRK